MNEDVSYLVASSIIFYDDVTPDGNGWFNPDFTFYLGNFAIEPQQAVIVKNIAGGAFSFTRAGHVKVGPTKLTVNPGFNALANPRAVGDDDDSNSVFNLGNSGLYTGVDGESVTGADDAAVADEVIFLNADGTTSTRIYDDVTLPAAENQGWWDPAFIAERSGETIVEGTGFLLREKGAGFVWTVPAEFIAE